MLAAGAIAVGILIAALAATGCADSSECEDDGFFVIVGIAVAMSSLALWPAAAYLVRWRSAARVAAGLKAPLIALGLMAYAQVGLRLLLTDWTPSSAVLLIAGTLFIVGWVVLGFGLVSLVVRRALERREDAPQRK